MTSWKDKDMAERARNARAAAEPCRRCNAAPFTCCRGRRGAAVGFHDERYADARKRMGLVDHATDDDGLLQDQVDRLTILIRRARPWVCCVPAVWPNQEVIDVKRAMDHAIGGSVVDVEAAPGIRAAMLKACAEAFHQGRQGDGNETAETVITRIVDDVLRGE